MSPIVTDQDVRRLLSYDECIDAMRIAFTNTRSEVARRVFERASAVIVNDWESVTENNQVELLEPIAAGALSRDCVHTIGDLVAGSVTVGQPPRGEGKGVIYYKNNSGLAIQFAAPGALLHRELKAEGTAREIPNEWLGTDLSALYAAGLPPVAVTRARFLRIRLLGNTAHLAECDC